jgi:hypothetical protein
VPIGELPTPIAASQVACAIGTLILSLVQFALLLIAAGVAFFATRLISAFAGARGNLPLVCGGMAVCAAATLGIYLDWERKQKSRGRS